MTQDLPPNKTLYMSNAQLDAAREMRVRHALAYCRLLHVIDYKAMLLATSAFWHPLWVRNISADRSIIRKAEAA